MGWTIDYIDSLPIKTTSIMIESINIENQRQEAEMRRVKMKSRMRRR